MSETKAPSAEELREWADSARAVRAFASLSPAELRALADLLEEYEKALQSILTKAHDAHTIDTARAALAKGGGAVKRLTAMLCEHANEVPIGASGPDFCTCKKNCDCRVAMCKPRSRKKPASWFQGEPDPKLAKVYVDLKEKGLLREDPTEQTAQEVYREVFVRMDPETINRTPAELGKPEILAAICRVLRRSR